MYVCHYCHGHADHLDGLTSILLSHSTGFGQEGATRSQRTFKLLLSSLRYCKNTTRWISHKDRRKYHTGWKGGIKFFDDRFWFIWVRGNNFQRVCKILPSGIFLNPRWPPKRLEIGIFTIIS